MADIFYPDLSGNGKGVVDVEEAKKEIIVTHSGELADIIATVADRTALIGVNTNSRKSAFLFEPNRMGMFVWDATIPVAIHSLDTQQGIYVAPNPAAAGAWVRQHDGAWNVNWFGVVAGGNSVDLAPAWRAMYNAMKIYNGGTIQRNITPELFVPASHLNYAFLTGDPNQPGVVCENDVSARIVGTGRGEEGYSGTVFAVAAGLTMFASVTLQHPKGGHGFQPQNILFIALGKLATTANVTSLLTKAGGTSAETTMSVDNVGDFKVGQVAFIRGMGLRMRYRAHANSFTRNRATVTAGSNRITFPVPHRFRGGEVVNVIDPADATKYLFEEGSFIQLVGNSAENTVFDLMKYAPEGPQLVNNGTFDTNITGWTATSAQHVWEAGRIKVHTPAAGSGRTAQTVTTEIGKTYRLSIEIGEGLGTPQVRVGSTVGGIQYAQFTTVGVNTVEFTATTTATYVLLYVATTFDATFYRYYDNVSIKEVYSNDLVASNASASGTNFLYIWDDFRFQIRGVDAAAKTITIAEGIYHTDSEGSTIEGARGVGTTVSPTGKAPVLRRRLEHYDCGIYTECKFDGTNVHFQNFKGAGVFGTGNSSVKSRTGRDVNTNESKITGECYFSGNFNGLVIQGSDSNGWISTGLNIKQGDSWGFIDATGTGGRHIGIHVSGTLGYFTPVPTAKVMIIGYKETGSWMCLGTCTQIFGSGFGNLIDEAGGISEIVDDDGRKIMPVMRLRGGSYTGGDVTLGDRRLGSGIMRYDGTVRGYAAEFQAFGLSNDAYPTLNDGLLCIFDANAEKCLLAFSLNGATNGSGNLYAPQGVLIGGGSNIEHHRHSYLGSRTAMPTSGSFRWGDYIMNREPAVLGTAGSRYIINGWKRMTTGSAHVLNTDWFEDRGLTGT